MKCSLCLKKNPADRLRCDLEQLNDNLCWTECPEAHIKYILYLSLAFSDNKCCNTFYLYTCDKFNHTLFQVIDSPCFFNSNTCTCTTVVHLIYIPLSAWGKWLLYTGNQILFNAGCIIILNQTFAYRCSKYLDIYSRYILT